MCFRSFQVILDKLFFHIRGGAPLWALGALPRGSWRPSYLWALDFQCPSPLMGSTALPQEWEKIFLIIG